MISRRLILSLVALATLFVTAGPASAQWKYLDREGRSHWVQTEGQVPAEYRAERPALPATGGGTGQACKTGDPKADASCSRAEWRNAMTKLCYVYGADTDDCREYRRVNAQRGVREMMRP